MLRNVHHIHPDSGVIGIIAFKIALFVSVLIAGGDLSPSVVTAVTNMSALSMSTSVMEARRRDKGERRANKRLQRPRREHEHCRPGTLL